MKKLLKSAFLAVCFLSLPGLVFAAKKTPVKAIQILPQVELSELSDATLMNIAMWEDFHTLEQFAQTCHKNRILAAHVFLMQTNNTQSQDKGIEQAILLNCHAIMYGIIDIVMAQNGQDGPHCIKKLTKKNSVDNVINFAVQKEWVLDLYVLLNDLNLRKQITPKGASDAVLEAYNKNFNACLFALMSNAYIMSNLDQNFKEGMMRIAISETKTDLVSAILQNKLILENISRAFIVQFIDPEKNLQQMSAMEKILLEALNRKAKFSTLPHICLVQ